MRNAQDLLNTVFFVQSTDSSEKEWREGKKSDFLHGIEQSLTHEQLVLFKLKLGDLLENDWSGNNLKYRIGVLLVQVFAGIYDETVKNPTPVYPDRLVNSIREQRRV